MEAVRVVVVQEVAKVAAVKAEVRAAAAKAEEKAVTARVVVAKEAAMVAEMALTAASCLFDGCCRSNATRARGPSGVVAVEASCEESFANLQVWEALLDCSLLLCRTALQAARFRHPDKLDCKHERTIQNTRKGVLVCLRKPEVKVAVAWVFAWLLSANCRSA
jgi:hypothetical protein